MQVNKQRFPTLGLHLKFSLDRILVYSGFGVDRFYCISMKTNIRR
jgi:hypothetical protein